MEGLLRRLIDGRLTDDRPLIKEHQRHFSKRARTLNICFFPGREKSPAAIESLGNGAYASFLNEPAYEGQPAFRYTITRQLPPKLFLYYWRDSATIRFLLGEGGWHLDERCKLLRNLRDHLRQGFLPMGRTQGAILWGLPEWKDQSKTRPREPTNIHIDLNAVRGKAAIRSVLEQAGGPMALSDIASVFWDAATPHENAYETLAEQIAVEPQGDNRIWLQQIADRVTHLFTDVLDDEDRQLLAARGYALERKPNRSFRAVATAMGSKRTAEYYRLKERRILQILRDTFPDRDDAEYAVEVLIQRLRGVHD